MYANQRTLSEESLKEIVREGQERIKTLKEELEKSQEDCDTTKKTMGKEVSTLKKELRENKKSLMDANNAVKTLKREKDVMKYEVEQTVKLQGEIQKLENLKGMILKENSDLGGEVAGLKMELKGLRQSLDQKEESRCSVEREKRIEIRGFEKKLEDTRKTGFEKEREWELKYRDMERVKEEKVREITGAYGKIREVEGEKATLMEERGALETTLQQREVEVKEGEEEIQRLREVKCMQLEDMASEKAKVEQQTQRLEGNISTLKNIITLNNQFYQRIHDMHDAGAAGGGGIDGVLESPSTTVLRRSDRGGARH